MFHNKISFSFEGWPEEAAGSHLKKEWNFSLQIDWRIAGWLQNTFYVFCFLFFLQEGKASISFHQQTKYNFFPLMCFFLLFASGSEPPCLWMNRGRIGPQLLGIWALHCLTWGTHWYFCCLSFLIYSVGLKLQKACNCLPQLLKGYLISLCSALKIKNSMQVLIIIITQTRARSC